MFGFFKKSNSISQKNIFALADGEIIDVTKVNDDVFSKKLLGESIAMKFNGESVCLCSPVSGTLSFIFPTGHAFGIQTKEGAEILIHIGINTVNAKGEGFEPQKKQGDKVMVGDPIVKVNFNRLSKQYDMSTMIIVTNSDQHPVSFHEPEVVNGESVIGTFL